MVERRHRASIATFFCSEPMACGHVVSLGGGEVHHARVRRLGVGDRVRLVDGNGTVGWGAFVKLTREHAIVAIDRVERAEPLAPIHLMVPIADRERMLLAAEKATELGISSWRPVAWRRSRSVAGRGEGASFQGKVRLRMINALTQSGGAWLPVLYPDATLERAIAACPPGARWLLDVDGDPVPVAGLGGEAPLTIAVGPEGGVEAEERDMLLGSGFVPVRLAPLTLRFETAVIAALAVARAALVQRPAMARD